jgi:hypothetical protein
MEPVFSSESLDIYNVAGSTSKNGVIFVVTAARESNLKQEKRPDTERYKRFSVGLEPGTSRRLYHSLIT